MGEITLRVRGLAFVAPRVMTHVAEVLAPKRLRRTRREQSELHNLQFSRCLRYITFNGQR